MKALNAFRWLRHAKFELMKIIVFEKMSSMKTQSHHFSIRIPCIRRTHAHIRTLNCRQRKFADARRHVTRRRKKANPLPIWPFSWSTLYLISASDIILHVSKPTRNRFSSLNRARIVRVRRSLFNVRGSEICFHRFWAIRVPTIKFNRKGKIRERRTSVT